MKGVLYNLAILTQKERNHRRRSPAEMTDHHNLHCFSVEDKDHHAEEEEEEERKDNKEKREELHGKSSRADAVAADNVAEEETVDDIEVAAVAAAVEADKAR